MCGALYGTPSFADKFAYIGYRFGRKQNSGNRDDCSGIFDWNYRIVERQEKIQFLSAHPIFQYRNCLPDIEGSFP